MKSAAARGDARQQSAAAERRDDGVDVGQVFEDLERDRAVAGDEPVVVERMDEVAAHAIGAVRFDGPPAFVVGGADDRGAEPLDGADLRLRRRVHHHHRARAPTSRAANATPCAALPALTVQTPSRSSLGRQLADDVVGAANLERSDRLQQFELQVQLGNREARSPQIEADERRANRRRRRWRSRHREPQTSGCVDRAP